MITSSILTTLARRRTGTIANITISRPNKLNALNTPLLEKLPQQVEAVTAQNADLLGIVLTGAGPKSFVGGADIAEMARLNSPAEARGFIIKVHMACKSVRDCPVPVIARVNGYALGAGCELAAACDLRVASRNAVFGMPEVCILFSHHHFLFPFGLCLCFVFYTGEKLNCIILGPSWNSQCC